MKRRSPYPTKAYIRPITSSVADLIGAELVIGLMYAFVGYGLLRFMEVQSRTHASLERS